MTARISLLSTSTLLGLSLLLCQCATQPPVAPPAAPRTPKDAFWNGDGVSGARKIVIDLTEQRIRYYKGGELVGMSPISSGKEGNSTVRGTFKIIEKDEDHRSTLYGAWVTEDGTVVDNDVDVRRDKRPPGVKFQGANMRYFMRVTGAIGMHEGYLPGYPASHGCIRVPTNMARIFFEETPLGTPVQITGDAALAGPQEHIPIGSDFVASNPTQVAQAAQAPAAPQPAPLTPQQRAAMAPYMPYMPAQGYLQPPANGRFMQRAAPKRQGPPAGTTLYLQ